MVSFAAYSSLQTNEDVSLTDMAMENAEALAQDINPLCPDGCLDIEDIYCFCYIPLKLKSKVWDPDNPSSPVE